MKNYIKPNAEVKNFISEDIITASGMTTNPLVKYNGTKTFNVTDKDASWNNPLSN